MNELAVNEKAGEKDTDSRFEKAEDIFFLAFDICLIILTTIALIASFFFKVTFANQTLAALSFLGLIPVVINAVKSLFEKRLSVDLLASIALVFSLLATEWFSAAFITLMLAFARLFDRITEDRAKKTIKSLMKYHVERVRLRIGDSVKEVSIHEVKAGDMAIVEAGDRMPVDGIVVSGEADVNESSLTGESELVQKKAGDRVFTSTINESGSLIVKVEKVGKDTTLSRMIALVEGASRDKNDAERVADRFTQWYIVLSLIASLAMYMLGLNSREILAVLLVVCADDIAVAVPLAFTVAMSSAAKRGVIVKGSSVFEQLSRMKYILTDKTGTLTRGRPKVVEIKAFSTYDVGDITKRYITGSSESNHAVSKAIMEYAKEKGLKPHVPDELEEIAGQGISFLHDGEKMLMGRLSFMENNHCHISDEVRKAIVEQKDIGNGIVCLAVNGTVVGVMSYRDELRPRVKDIIAETKQYGIREWHMLTGDNERTAAAVAHELGIRHFHANMTPEGKVEFIRKFEIEHSNAGNSRAKHDPKKGIVGYIGDGVNDAASLALADVSIAMGGIGADAAIEASDITIMKDHLDRVPEVVGMSKKVMNVMWGNFWIWGITNLAGLALVAVGILGPAGAATYNFLTDFIPIGNAFRARRR